MGKFNFSNEISFSLISFTMILFFSFPRIFWELSKDFTVSWSGIKLNSSLLIV